MGVSNGYGFIFGSSTRFSTKFDRYNYQMRQFFELQNMMKFYQKMHQLFYYKKNATVITKRQEFMTKCDVDENMHQYKLAKIGLILEAKFREDS